MKAQFILGIALLFGSFLMFNPYFKVDEVNETSDHDWDALYIKYLSEFSKQYDSLQMYSSRKEIFKSKYIEIEAHNRNENRTFDKGLNIFSDWTLEERKALTPEKSQIDKDYFPNLEYLESDENVEADFKIDWVSRGKVMDVRWQETCGSCWAMAAIGAVQALLGGKMLSVQ